MDKNSRELGQGYDSKWKVWKGNPVTTRPINTKGRGTQNNFPPHSNLNSSRSNHHPKPTNLGLSTH